MFCLESFQMIADGVSKFLSFSFQVTIAGFTSFIKKKSRLVEDVLFYPKKELMTFPKIEIKWDSVGNVHVYIKSDVVILLWQYCHVRSCQTSGN